MVKDLTIVSFNASIFSSVPRKKLDDKNAKPNPKMQKKKIFITSAELIFPFIFPINLILIEYSNTC
jgi:hypothetical protein